jgi:2-hydroxychromene-2-carboxylate isomerase
MAKTVEFWFDFGSPASYLAWTQIGKIARDAGAQVDWKPMLLGGVFKATGNQSPVMIKPKGAWMFGDLARWAKRYGVGFEMNPFFIINTLPIMRGAAGLQLKDPQRLEKYIETMFRAMWERPVNLGDPVVIGATLQAAGFDAAAMMNLVNDPEVKQRLITLTDEAVSRGVFGAPTMFVGGEMHFGQDRLEFVKEALRR